MVHILIKRKRVDVIKNLATLQVSEVSPSFLAKTNPINSLNNRSLSMKKRSAKLEILNNKNLRKQIFLIDKDKKIVNVDLIRTSFIPIQIFICVKDDEKVQNRKKETRRFLHIIQEELWRKGLGKICRAFTDTDSIPLTREIAGDRSCLRIWR